MQWPQYTVIALFVIGFVGSAANHVRNRDLDSNQVTLRVMLHIALIAAYAVVLERGGFW